MPQSMERLYWILTLVPLANRFNVSEQAMTIRLSALGLL